MIFFLLEDKEKESVFLAHHHTHLISLDLFRNVWFQKPIEYRKEYILLNHLRGFGGIWLSHTGVKGGDQCLFTFKGLAANDVVLEKIKF